MGFIWIISYRIETTDKALPGENKSCHKFVSLPHQIFGISPFHSFLYMAACYVKSRTIPTLPEFSIKVNIAKKISVFPDKQTKWRDVNFGINVQSSHITLLLLSYSIASHPNHSRLWLWFDDETSAIRNSQYHNLNWNSTQDATRILEYATGTYSSCPLLRPVSSSSNRSQYQHSVDFNHPSTFVQFHPWNRSSRRCGRHHVTSSIPVGGPVHPLSVCPRPDEENVLARESKRGDDSNGVHQGDISGTVATYDAKFSCQECHSPLGLLRRRGGVQWLIRDGELLWFILYFE